MKKIPHGHRIDYEDEPIVVYNDKNEIVEETILDYSAYKDEPYKWNEAGGYYDLPQGYKMVSATRRKGKLSRRNK